MPKPNDPTATEIPCTCGTDNCKVGMRITDVSEEKVKLQILNSKDIDSIVINKRRLIKLLQIGGRKITDSNYVQIMNLIPKDRTVLDLGCGNGQSFAGSDFPVLVGVDIWKKKFDMPEYDEVYFHDIREILKLYPKNSFDIVIAIDTIEHLEKEEGLKLIEDAEKIALNKVIFFTPRKWSENKEAVENKKYWSYGNPYDYHKSNWTEEDFTSRGYEIIPNKDYILAQKVIK